MRRGTSGRHLAALAFGMAGAATACGELIDSEHMRDEEEAREASQDGSSAGRPPEAMEDAALADADAASEVDAAPDVAAFPFFPRDNCSPPLPMPEIDGGVFSLLQSSTGVGGPLVVDLTTDFADHATSVWSGNSWSTPSPLPDSNGIDRWRQRFWRFASGAGRTVLLGNRATAGDAFYSTVFAFESAAPTTRTELGPRKGLAWYGTAGWAVAVGSSGHVLETWVDDGQRRVVISTAEPSGAVMSSPAALTRLPPSLDYAFDGVVDATGDGFVFYSETEAERQDALRVAMVRGSAWLGTPAAPTTANAAALSAFYLNAVPLATGAYVVWSRGTDGIFGARASFDPASSGAKLHQVEEVFTDPTGDVCLYPGYVSGRRQLVATEDGELTLIAFSQKPRSTKVFALRRRVGEPWSAPVELGVGLLAYTYVGPLVEPGGHVSVVLTDDENRLWLHRIAKGSSTWSPPVRVDPPSGNGAGRDARAVIDPATGHVLVIWPRFSYPSSLVYTRCQ